MNQKKKTQIQKIMVNYIILFIKNIENFSTQKNKKLFNTIGNEYVDVRKNLFNEKSSNDDFTNKNDFSNIQLKKKENYNFANFFLNESNNNNKIKKDFNFNQNDNENIHAVSKDIQANNISFEDKCTKNNLSGNKNSENIRFNTDYNIEMNKKIDQIEFNAENDIDTKYKNKSLKNFEIKEKYMKKIPNESEKSQNYENNINNNLISNEPDSKRYI